jgi:hypothetical protein
VRKVTHGQRQRDRAGDRAVKLEANAGGDELHGLGIERAGELVDHRGG